MHGEQFVETAKASVALEVGAHVVQGARDVLDIHGITARNRLEAEGSPCLQIALDSHQVEPSAEFIVVLRARLLSWAAPERNEELNQVVHFGFSEIDVR